MRQSKLILAQGQTFSFNSNETGLNNNVMVIGTTGSGKTVSITEAQLLNTFTNSIVVTATKRRIVDKYVPIMKNRGFNTVEINLTNPSLSDVGFDPVDCLKNQSDIMDYAKTIIESVSKADLATARDPYWDNAAMSLIAAEISLLMERWSYEQQHNEHNEKGGNLTLPPSMEDVLELHGKLYFYETDKSGFTKSSLDKMFEIMEARKADSYAVACWRAVKGLAAKTVSCVLSTVSVAYSRLFTPQIRQTMMNPFFSPLELATRPTALFIVTSPVNQYAQSFANLLYSSIFKELYEYAESLPDYRLPIPVHLICDDFACGCKIPNFSDYISIIREPGISTTILVQSETQLTHLYGIQDATTIINNCDSIVYMGGMDINTCANIAKRLDVPVGQALNMPLKKVYVFRRGSLPVLTDRYQTYEDETYKAEVICEDDIEMDLDL